MPKRAGLCDDWGMSAPVPHAPNRYDTIGTNYSTFRRTEPTWQAEIDNALGDAVRVLNIGAGPGSYEDLGRDLIALEPSATMIAQRSPDAAPCIQGVAEALPFADDAFDATMGILTMHHWIDRAQAFSELARLAPRHVYTLYDTEVAQGFWLTDYFPETRTHPMEVQAPTAELLSEWFDVVDERPLWVPKDCCEGFAAAAWDRPHLYLDPERQKAVSLLALSTPEARERGTERLRSDLESGAWHDKYGEILEVDRADFGYRLVTFERR